MTMTTASMYVKASSLKAGMRILARPNEQLREIEDIAILDSEGRLRVTLSDNVDHRMVVETYAADALIEVHLTLDEAVSEVHRLAAAEDRAYRESPTLGDQRVAMYRLAQSIGWQG
jgi:hypothetical protein